MGSGTKRGGNAAFRKVNKGIAAADQVVRIEGTYLRMSSWCLTPHNWKATEDKVLTWWNCLGRNEQKWDTSIDI